MFLKTIMFRLNFHTSHHQFYIYDKDSAGDTGSDNFWTNVASNDRLAVEDGILGIGTECYGPVKAELHLLNHAPTNVILEDYDHIVEAGIEIKSGTIQVFDCPFSSIELEIEVIPGTYNVRIYSQNLASVDGDEGDDCYKIEIWPGNEMERVVIKRYSRTLS